MFNLSVCTKPFKWPSPQDAHQNSTLNAEPNHINCENEIQEFSNLQIETQERSPPGLQAPAQTENIFYYDAESIFKFINFPSKSLLTEDNPDSQFSSTKRDKSLLPKSCTFIISDTEKAFHPKSKEFSLQNMPRFHYANFRYYFRSPFLAPPPSISDYIEKIKNVRSHPSQYSIKKDPVFFCQICQKEFDDPEKHRISKEHLHNVSEMKTEFEDLDALCQDSYNLPN